MIRKYLSSDKEKIIRQLLIFTNKNALRVWWNRKAAYICTRNAKVAQLVEHNLAKVGVAGSNPVSRSSEAALSGFFIGTYQASVVELVDTQDLKSCDHCGRMGSSPIRGTTEPDFRRAFFM